MRERSLVGLTRTKVGWRAFIRVRGRLYSKRFPPDASISAMQDWRQATRVDALRRELAAPTTASTFAADVDAYLRAVRAMPTYAEREWHMDLWVAALGPDRTRQSITSAEIRAVLHRWRLSGRKDGKPLAESSVNNRRTALMHFFSVMNGKSGANPCRDVPKFREPDAQPRGLTWATLARIFKQMPESKAKARAMVMCYTGLPHATLMRLTRESVDYKAHTVIVPRRRKGAGTVTRVLPLLPEAVRAFKRLDRWDAWGHFSRGSLRRTLQRACRAAKVTPIRAYDLRHSFGAEVYRSSGDIGAVQALLDHADAKMTARYTLTAVDEQMKRALASTRKVATKVTSAQKRQ